MASNPVFLFNSFLQVKPTNSSSHTDTSNLVSSLGNLVLGGAALDELVSGNFSGRSEFGNSKCEDKQGKFVLDR